jgi:hypothetical protein
MEGLMRRIFCLLFFLLCFYYQRVSFAEEYSECRARCAEEEADCMNEPLPSDAEVQAAKESSCAQKVQTCYAECENLRPVNDEIAPESNPNIIHK